MILRKKSTYLIGVYALFLLVGFFYTLEYSDTKLEGIFSTTITDDLSNTFSIERDVDVDISTAFNLFTDIEQFSKVLPSNVISVKIINQTEYDTELVTFSEQKLSARGIESTLILKHTSVIPILNKIEVVTGDAQGTIIRQTFESQDSDTKIKFDILLRTTDKFSLFSAIPQSEVEDKLNLIIDKFLNS